MKRLIALSLLAAMLAAAPFAFARTHSQAATSVNVTAKEFRFVLSRKRAPHGKVVFHVVNKGKLKHDFKIAGKKTPLLKPGGKATVRVTLQKRSYTYVCTVVGHAKLGMKGVFRAT
jgi:plastocyanin